MADIVKLMPSRKRIALIAHDNCKAEMLEWAEFNRHTLATHELHATGTTGTLLAFQLGLTVPRFLSGPVGTSKRGCASPWCATCRRPATAPPQTSSSPAP